MSEIDLKPFCDIEDGRFARSTPFVRKGYRYATDGRICVRVPCDEPDTPSSEKKRIASPESVFDSFPVDGFGELAESIVEKQDHPHGITRPCKCCKEAPCHKCFGSGRSECHACGQDADCEDCDGTGKELRGNPSCKLCDDGEVPVVCCKIGNAFFSDIYLDKVAAIPGVAVAQVGEGKQSMLAFRFDGGQGLLMCLDME